MDRKIKVFVIITGEGSEGIEINEEEKTEKEWWEEIFRDHQPKYEIENKECVIWIIKGPWNENELKGKANSLLEDLKNKLCKKEIDEVVVYVHLLNTSKVFEIGEDQPYNKIECDCKKSINVSWVGYTTASVSGGNAIETIKNVIKILYENKEKFENKEKLKDSKTIQQFQQLCNVLGSQRAREEVKKKYKREQIKKQPTLLSHRIVHLFLPLDIDLMGLREVCSSSSEESGNEYLMEILGGKSKKDKDTKADFYRRKYLQALYLLFGLDEFPEFQLYDEVICKKVELTNEEKTGLLENKNQNLAEIVKDTAATNILQEIEYWMGVKNGGQGKKVDPDHPIPKFFCYLDSLIANSSNPSVENLLNNEKKTFDQLKKLLSKHEELKKENVETFHDWFCELMKRLEELQEKIS